MKKLLLVLCALLTGVGVWAEDVKIANTGDGLPSTFGSFNENVFTTNAASGLAGITVAGEAGLTIDEQVVNVANYGNCFKIVTAAAATDYKVTLTAPDGYIITGYSLGCSANTKNAVHTLTSEDGTVQVVASAPPYNNPTGPKAFEVAGLSAQSTYFTINTENSGNTLYLPTFTITVRSTTATYVNVTYELYEADGTTLVTSVTTEQVAGSDVDYPATFVNSYFDLSTTDVIGDEDCTIKVVRTLKDNTIVYPFTKLNNSKAYTLTTSRGSLGTNGTQLVSTNGTSFSASNFAIISYEDKYFLYSVADSKFVGNPTTIDGVADQAILTEDLSQVSPVSFALTTVPLYFMKMGSYGVNVNNSTRGAVVDSWVTVDAGNQYLIQEADDFDATAAVDALEEYFHPAAEIVFNEAIATLESIPFGTGLGQYSFTGDYAGYTNQAATIIAGLKSAGYSDENLAIAQGLLANYTLNMPSAGFYRIKGKTSGLYLAAGYASNNKFNMTDAIDGTTVFYFDGNVLVNFASGLANGMTASEWKWIWDLGNTASEVVFQDGLTLGGYAIQSGTANFYDNGDNTGSADRGSNVAISSSTNARYTNWSLEEVTTLPVSVSAAGYATLYAPVALAVAEGVTVYTISEVAEGSATLAEVEGTTIPAETAVILKAAAGTYNFAITEDVAAISGNLLEGVVAPQAWTNEFTLQTSDLGVGLFSKEVPYLAAFKAYLPANNAAGVKGILFDTETAVKSIEAAENTEKAIFDLSGRRVEKAVKGLYIVGGKKVIVK